MRSAFSIFHLNLSYSSIDESEHGEVIDRCYFPLIRLSSDAGYKVGVELSGWTLERIFQLRPDWVLEFIRLHDAGKVELIGSGYCQIIGPLAPCEINRWNQQLGIESYDDILSIRPKLALVNEMAFSTGLVGVYRDAGYQGIVMDRDNVALALGIQSENARMPTHADGGGGVELPVLWADSMLFQKMQHYAHGDIRQCDYIDYFNKRSKEIDSPLAIYANDAEVFDYRPGRFETEPKLHSQNEWKRVNELFDLLSSSGVEFCLPSQALTESLCSQPELKSSLTTLRQPVPVKKQAKYNIGRWAISGRDDIWLNTICHRLSEALLESPGFSTSKELQQDICRLWSSDLRTHITESRWHQAKLDIERISRRLSIDLEYGVSHREYEKSGSIRSSMGHGFQIECDPDDILMHVKSSDISLSLNMRRGLAIHSLSFHVHQWDPVIGTLPHGYFDSIELGADFYSGNCVIDLVKERRRVTDLDRVYPEYRVTSEGLLIHAEVETVLGVVVKQVCIKGSAVSLRYSFPGWDMPQGAFRLGTMTLIPSAVTKDACLVTRNGGSVEEVFDLDRECFHSEPASALVTSSSGFGATNGEIIIRGKGGAVKFAWDPAKSAVFPMFYHRYSSPSPMSRLFFSMAELDDTARAGGIVPDFCLTVNPII